jgi:FAD/FMN-containing dehydrogenase
VITEANEQQVYGENWDRLVELKKKYDPKNKLKGPIRI